LHGRFYSEGGLKPSEKLRNGHETVRNIVLLGKFDTELSNALERIVENVHVSKTKEKQYYIVLCVQKK